MIRQVWKAISAVGSMRHWPHYYLANWCNYVPVLQPHSSSGNPASSPSSPLHVSFFSSSSLCNAISALASAFHWLKGGGGWCTTNLDKSKNQYGSPPQSLGLRGALLALVEMLKYGSPLGTFDKEGHFFTFTVVFKSSSVFLPIPNTTRRYFRNVRTSPINISLCIAVRQCGILWYERFSARFVLKFAL